MDGATLYVDFKIEVRLSIDTNDHEVRFLADGQDIISNFWSDMIGLDPDDLLAEPCQLRCSDKPHKAMVARCNCGDIGCGSIEVEVARSTDAVEWTWGYLDSLSPLKFQAGSYDAEVERVLHDFTWETPDRTVARLLAAEVDREVLRRYGLTYSWASGRIHQSAITVSLRLDPGPYQVLVHLPWNTASPVETAHQCAERLSEPPTTWSNAEWFPQLRDLGPPILAGPRWRQGGL